MFENGVGSFYATFEQDGRKIIGRLQRSAMTPTSAHWEPASSYDGGKTWQPQLDHVVAARPVAPPRTCSQAMRQRLCMCSSTSRSVVRNDRSKPISSDRTMM
jgi:hypothetical protein